VPHRALLEKLTSIGLNKYLIKWVASYLTSWKQQVVVNGSCSNFSPIISGLPQGSVLGPLPFIIYINEVAQLPLTADSKLVTYANDILLYRPVHSTADLICLQEDTTSLGHWANSVNLRFNPRKCKVMILSKSKHVATPSPFLLNGQPVDFVDNIRYFGLTISADLSWSKDITSITPKARQLVGLLFWQF